MKLNKKDFCKAMKTYETLWTETNKALNYLKESFTDQYLDAYYDLFITACGFKNKQYLMAAIDWFCFDTDFGQNKETRIINDKNTIWDITTPERLYEYLTTKK